jgi:hypothetical protein
MIISHGRIVRYWCGLSPAAQCPAKSFAILEGRERSGGTWDLFRYPGIRSDSDMFTMGYSFKPWNEPKAIADGPNILNYIRSGCRNVLSAQSLLSALSCSSWPGFVMAEPQPSDRRRRFRSPMPGHPRPGLSNRLVKTRMPGTRPGTRPR